MSLSGYSPVSPKSIKCPGLRDFCISAQPADFVARLTFSRRRNIRGMPDANRHLLSFQIENRVQSFFDVQWPSRLAVPIVKSQCLCFGGTDFQHLQSRVQAMDRPGGNPKAITGSWLITAHQRGNRFISNSMVNIISVNIS